MSEPNSALIVPTQAPAVIAPKVDLALCQKLYYCNKTRVSTLKLWSWIQWCLEAVPAREMIHLMMKKRLMKA